MAPNAKRFTVAGRAPWPELRLVLHNDDRTHDPWPTGMSFER